MSKDKAAKTTSSPSSGSKLVGVKVEYHGGIKHFPQGCKWRYAKVLDETMLEVFESKGGAILFQCHRGAVLSVCGEGYTTPMWLSREYPLPAE